MLDTFRVVPDGSIFHRVAEFTFAKKQHAQALFEADREGYTDAVAKLVQTLSSSQKIVTGRGNPFPEGSEKLRTVLIQAGRHEESTFFEPKAVEERKTAAALWLSEQWSSVLGEMENPDSAVATAVLGTLKREFYLAYVNVNQIYKPSWLSPQEEVIELPVAVRKRFLREICKLARTENYPVKEQEFERWIDQVVTSHFRIFGEYWLFLGKETGDEYLPSLSRSSLSFLSTPPLRGSVEELIVPFVGLAAIKKAKDRASIIDAAVDWSTGEGRDIIEDMDQLQNILRTTKVDDGRKRLIDGVTASLRSRMPRGLSIALNGVRLLTQLVRGQVEVSAAQTIWELSVSSSYRWLWRIREPQLEREWRERLASLMK